ncbi:MAG TPA: hypothetical protein VKA18_13635, partial [Alphaproteobacteria bacterium]|nr:hypothetical protein [Alphaproteobacteria bacterium]
MTLSIDVDSTGLVPNAEYDGVPPTVNSVFSDGRWGFRTTDSTGVAFPQYELAHVFFGQSAFTLGFSFNAADGPGSAGEFFRIHQSLFLRIEADGALRLDFISNADIRHTFTSQPTSALDGDWHDILISYDGTTGELRLDL